MTVPGRTVFGMGFGAVLLLAAGLCARDAGGDRPTAGFERGGSIRPGGPGGPDPPDQGKRITLILPDSLAPERGSYEREVSSAVEEVAGFFRAAGLELPAEGMIESVMVFGSSGEARAHLAKRYGIPPEGIPETFSGTVEGRMLFLVSRESYRRIWSTLYRDWPWADSAYHGLIVHELAHRAHESAAIARHGSPDAMGPAWFFEGLAVTCARQFVSAEPPMTPAEIGKVAGWGKTPGVSYPLYGRLVRSLAAKFTVKELIDRASEKGFPEVLWSGKGDQRKK